MPAYVNSSGIEPPSTCKALLDKAWAEETERLNKALANMDRHTPGGLSWRAAHDEYERHSYARDVLFKLSLRAVEL